MTTASDIRVKSPDELKALLVDLRKEQFNLRFQRATGQQENTSRVRAVRRDIARVHPGRIVFEIDGVAEPLAREALALGAAKLPIRTKFVTRIGDA